MSNVQWATCCPYTFQPLSNPEATTSEYVDKELPANWANSVTLTVALAGARASGKSLYIAVLVKLLEDLLEKHGHTMRAADASTERNYRENYENPLFDEMGILDSTPSAGSGDAYQRDPLIYDIGTWSLPVGERKVFLVLRDVAGEDLQTLPSDLTLLDFFQYAQETIFLFDPLTVDEIAMLLREAGRGEGLGEPADRVLDNLLRVLGPQPQRLAVTLSKFDTLRELENSDAGKDWSDIMSNYGAAFNRQLDPPYAGNDPELLNLEVRSLLLRMEARRIVNTLNEIDQTGEFVRYFVVSSLGRDPHGSNIDRAGIASFRVLDPLLWLFYDHGIMNPNGANS